MCAKSASRSSNNAVLRSIWVYFCCLVAAFVLFSVCVVLFFRWVPVPTSSFMIQRQFQALINNEPNRTIHHHWVDADHISWTAKLAAITSEDQRFPQHRGFDLEQIQKALQESRRGESLRGASTITQQTAKNLFLWPGRNYLRKGLEAYFTILLELCWPKERILEVYLNSAEFGSGIYGVQKAAEIFFNTTANKLSKSQSALLVTALPSPRRYNVAAPSDYMIRRQQWVLQYMNALGNQAYLKSL